MLVLLSWLSKVQISSISLETTYTFFLLVVVLLRCENLQTFSKKLEFAGRFTAQG